jgi:hypothetical protein
VVAFPELLPELPNRIHRRIDVAPNRRLGVSHTHCDFLKRRIAHDEQVDVATAVQGSARGRPKHERHTDSLVQRSERLAHDLYDSRRLQNERLQFRKDRRRAIGLKINLPSLDGSPQHARAGERLELTLDRALRAPRLANDLPQIVRLISMSERPSKNPAPRLPEENTSGVVS